jgi:hypothetical protein
VRRELALKVDDRVRRNEGPLSAGMAVDFEAGIMALIELLGEGFPRGLSVD